MLRPNTGGNSSGILKVTAALNVSVIEGPEKGLKFPYRAEFIACPQTVQSIIYQTIDMLHKEPSYEGLSVEQIVMHTEICFNKGKRLYLPELSKKKTQFSPLIAFNRVCSPAAGEVLMLSGSISTNQLASNGLDLHVRGKRVASVSLGTKGKYPLFGDVFPTIEEAISSTLTRSISGPIKVVEKHGEKTVLPMLTERNQLVMYRALYTLASEYARHTEMPNPLPFPTNLQTAFWREYVPAAEEEEMA